MALLNHLFWDWPLTVKVLLLKMVSNMYCTQKPIKRGKSNGPKLEEQIVILTDFTCKFLDVLVVSTLVSRVLFDYFCTVEHVICDVKKSSSREGKFTF